MVPNSSRRFAPTLAVGVCVVVLAMMAALLNTAPADAQSREKRPILSRSSVDEAPDFASTALADPWDFGQERDLPNIDNLNHRGFTNVSFSGGRWRGTAASQANISLLQSWNSLPNGRDGESTPIDADEYTHISLRMRFTGNQPAVWGEVSWYDCGRLVQSCRGAQGVRVFEGWHTYDFELQRDPTRGPVDWAGEIRGLVLTPSAPGGNIEIDWVRLYQPTNDPITVTSRDTDPNVRLIWDRDRDQSNNTAANSNWELLADGPTATFNPDALAPGNYHIYSQVGSTRSLVHTLKINKRPRPRVLQPDAVGGLDYATTVRGDAWDFNQASDVSRISNMTFSTSNGELLGRNGGSTPSDSWFHLDIPEDAPIDGSRFTNFSARVFYEGGFSLSGNPGGGMNARIVWRTTTGVWRVSEDIVVFPGWNTISVDLDDTPPQDLIEGGATSAAWAGNQIDILRFDPHEDKGTREFRIDWIKVTENDKPRANNVFNIGFRDLGHEQGSKVRIFLDRDGDGIGERQIAFRSIWFGHNIHRWTVPADLRGTGEWFVTIRVTDPKGVSTSATSKGTVEL